VLTNKCSQADCQAAADFELVDVLDMSTDNTDKDITLHLFSCGACLSSILTQSLGLCQGKLPEIAVRRAERWWN